MHGNQLQKRPLARFSATQPVLHAVREMWQRQWLLTLHGFGMLLLMLPASVMLLIDTSTVHGLPAWAKPLKFMAATALFALTSAWFIGLLDPHRRASPTIRFVVWSIILSSLFEVAYISHQALNGAASHYNMDTTLASLMFSLMAIAAVVLCFSQLVLAHQVWRWSSDGNSLYRSAVITGLILTFVLSVLSGFMLGGKQPPPGMGLPIVGWHLTGGDLRPAHFLAVHAQQALPLLGFALQTSRLSGARTWFTLFAMGYLGLWFWLLGMGLDAG